MPNPDFNPEDEASITADLESASLRPAAIFRGKPLWPLTKASSKLLLHVAHRNDMIVVSALAFIFVHTKRGGATFRDDLARHVLPIAYEDINVFRAAVLELGNELTDEEEVQALALFKETFDLVRKSEVTAIKPGARAALPKKKAVTPTRKRGSASRSRK